VESYLDVYLRTPGLIKGDIIKALLARGNARKAAGEQLLVKAQQDLLAVARLDPARRTLFASPSRENTGHRSKRTG